MAVSRGPEMTAIEAGAFCICEISVGRPDIAQIADGAGRHLCDVWKAPEIEISWGEPLQVCDF